VKVKTCPTDDHDVREGIVPRRWKRRDVSISPEKKPSGEGKTTSVTLPRSRISPPHSQCGEFPLHILNVGKLLVLPYPTHEFPLHILVTLEN
jgi:hypothetical protein